jgi:sRNA-binding protein
MASFSKTRWENILVLEKMLFANHPKAFVPFGGPEDAVYPLKVGIDKQITALYPEIDAAVLASFMKHYVSLPRYLRITGRPGMPRVDLYGNVDSVVSEYDAKNALRFLDRKIANRAKQKGTPVKAKTEGCSFTGKIQYASAFEADQAMIRTRTRDGAKSSLTKGHSFKCACGFYHWGRD